MTKLKNSNCDKTKKTKLWQNSTFQIITKLNWSAYLAELLKFFLLLADVFYFDANGRICFCFREIPTFNKLNEVDLTMCQVFTDNSTLWTLFEPNQIIFDIMIDQSQKEKSIFISKDTVYLFVLKMCWCKAQRYMRSLVTQPESSKYNYNQKLKLWLH